MLRNYLITALRNLKRNKVYTVLNVLGLALGIGCAVVIFKVIRYETSFDTHHENFQGIYRVVSESIYPDRVDKGQGVPHPMGNALRDDYPELAIVSRMHYAYGDQINIKDGDGPMKKFLIEEGLAFVDNEFFQILNWEWIAGDQATAMTEPRTVVITESQAEALFGYGKGQSQEAMGRIINYNNLEDFTVVGVVKDPLETTNFPFTMMFEYESGLDKTSPYYGNGERWNSTSSSTNAYFIPENPESFNVEAFNIKLIEVVKKYLGEDELDESRFVVQPLTEIHYDEDYGSYGNSTSRSFLISLGIIALFLIITACINFINLSTAQAANRSKEIGIRKAIGGMSGQLVFQFLCEIAVITLFAVLLSLAISELMFIVLEDLLGYRLTLDLLNDMSTVGFLVALFVVVSLLSGFYPSLLLSRMNTVMALKSKITSKSHSGGLSLRKGLVVLQFGITQFLIIGTLIITAQMKYFGSKDLGFETEAIITTYLPQRDDEVKNERFRQKMLQSSAISDVTYSISQPLGNSNSHSNFNYAPLESENDYHANFKVADERYLEFFDIDLLAGRGLQKGDSNNIVINQRIADLMGFEDNYEGVLAEKLNTGWNGDKSIVGVVENFHSNSLSRNLDYVILLYLPEVWYAISFKTSSEQGIEAALDHYRNSWEEIFPEYVSDYEFYDEEIAERYEYEKNIASMMRIFASISILIGCLGLYGLISFIAQNKIKEIGVRKVLGASIISILGMFSKEIMVLISVAFVVASPLAYYLMESWLSDYAFRIALGFEFFIIAFGITLAIALITISHRTISSALVNPAYTLKDE